MILQRLPSADLIAERCCAQRGCLLASPNHRIDLATRIPSVQAMAGLHGGSRLPPHLLFSDRDFNENDYEALLALDDGIENRRGECSMSIHHGRHTLVEQI